MSEHDVCDFRPGDRVRIGVGLFEGQLAVVQVVHAEGCKVVLDNGYEREYAFESLTRV